MLLPFFWTGSDFTAEVCLRTKKSGARKEEEEEEEKREATKRIGVAGSVSYTLYMLCTKKGACSTGYPINLMCEEQLAAPPILIDGGVEGRKENE